MEGIYTTSEHDSDDDDKESGGKKKKSAEAIGAFVVEPKTEAADKKPPAERPSFLDLLSGKRQEADKQMPEAEESEVSLSELSQEETLAVEREIAISRQTETVDQEAEAAGGETAAAAAVERFHDKIITEAKDADQALLETLAEIEVTDAEAETAEEIPVKVVEAPREFTDEAVELKTPAADDAEAAVIPPVPPSGHAGGTSTSGSSGGAGSGTAGPGASYGAGGGFGGGAPFRPAPGSAPSSPGPKTTEYITIQDNRNIMSATLLGGLVGYLLGRRRGRIKTERRLLPIQKKLEKQVENLQQDIIAKEATIRRAVFEKRGETMPVSVGRAEQDRRRNLPPLGKIGEVVVTAQTETSPAIDRAKPEAIARHVETLSRVDLLELSSKIIIEGSSLRQAYETNLISEKALRRIVAEHLRGGDVRRALRRELVEHQIDFERDPQLRDRPAQASSNGGATLSDLLKQANVDSFGESEVGLDSAKSRAAPPSNKRPTSMRRHGMDIVMLTTIVVLLIVVVMLVFGRH